MKIAFPLWLWAMLAIWAGTQDGHSVDILPNPVVVNVTASRATTGEGESQPGVFTIRRAGPLASSVLVYYRLTGTAVAGVDFEASSESVSIPAGAESVDIGIAAKDDDIAEPDETVVLTITSPIRPLAAVGDAVAAVLFYQIGEPASATVTIKDNDAGVSLPTVSIATSISEAFEDGPKNGEFVVSRFGQTEGALLVGYEFITDPITWPPDRFLNSPLVFPIFRVPAAQNGVDYQQLAGTVLIPAGEKSARIPIVPIDDDKQEGREHVTLRLLRSAAYNVNAPDASTVFILDGDERPFPPKVSIDEPRSGERFAEHADIKVRISTADADGYVPKMELFDGEKLVASERHEFLIKPPNGQVEIFEFLWKDVPAGKHKLIAVATDDSELTGQSASVEIVVLEGAVQPVVTIKATRPEVLESGARSPGRFTVYRSGSTRTRLIVHYVIGGTALNEIDYDKLSGAVTIRAGEDSTDILIKPIPDKALEGNETVTLTLDQRVFILPPAPEEDYIVGDPKSATVVIVENPTHDLPVVTMTMPDGEASEADPKNTATVLVQRTGNLSAALRVFYEISSNAENGEDYRKLSGIVTIPAHKAEASIVIDPLTDRKLEGKELVTLMLVQRLFIALPRVEDDYQIGSPRAATVVISDSPFENTPPKVEIVSPKNGAEFRSHSDIRIRAEASDSDRGVLRVDLLANDDLIATLVGGPFSFNWKNVAAGKYILRAKVTDAAGATSTSERVEILVAPPIDESFVKRQLPDTYTPQETLKVVLEATPASSVQVYAVEDKPPRGWTVGNISDNGTFDSASREVKFGPFFDNRPRALTYELMPPANESGPREFAGTASADGVDSRIGGDRTITSARNRHPADNDPTDNAITIHELTACALAWKAGKEWPGGPNPIPQSYVTRAGEIWRQGESYTYDPSQGPAPLWWVPKQRAALLTLEDTPNAAQVSQVPGRAVRSFNRAGQDDGLGYVVTIEVLPKPGVDAYTAEEHPPAGWTVSQVSENGNFDVASGIIRWGIFLDDGVRKLSYQVAPPDERQGKYPVFEGAASFDGIDVPIHSDKEPPHGRGNSFGRIEGLRRHATGECEVSFSAKTGHRYKIQVSVDLVKWIDLSSVLSESGQIQLLDTEAATSDSRYYRAISTE